MADILPILRNTTGTLNAQVLYPFTRTVSCLTSVAVFQNANEQRCVERPPLYGFVLPFSNLLGVDKNAWLTFFSSSGVIGRFGHALQLSLGGTTYSNLTLMSDALPFHNVRPLMYDTQVVLRQVKADNFSSYTPPTVGSSYPNLKFGAATTTSVGVERPFVQVSTYLTSVTDNTYGPRFAYSWYGAGLTNFPTGYLRSWDLTYPLITDDDLGTLEQFFLGKQGKYISFSFTDPIDSVTYPHVRFDMDELKIQYLTSNQNSLRITLLQTFNS